MATRRDHGGLQLWLHPHAPAVVSHTRPGRVFWAYNRDDGCSDPADFHAVSSVTFDREALRIQGPRLERYGIVAEGRRQFFGMGGPFLFFADFSRPCRDCGDTFTFTASEQQWWYEEQGAFVDAAAVRCLGCRRAAREGRVTQGMWQSAQELWDPKHPNARTAELYASAAHALVQAGGGTRRVLDDAVGVLHKAMRAEPEAAALEGWLARLELARGRGEAAWEAGERFLERTSRTGHRALKALRKAVEDDLAPLREDRRVF